MLVIANIIFSGFTSENLGFPKCFAVAPSTIHKPVIYPILPEFFYTSLWTWGTGFYCVAKIEETNIGRCDELVINSVYSKY